MKLIQARIPEPEFELLKRTARSEGKTMQEWVRLAIRDRLFPEAVDPSDPLFASFPIVRRRGPTTHVAEEHDRHLYGPAP
ncbi:MAG: hypothetical protein L3K00_04470 [Thermoplasmata archaeon]|nr:hypothetical protein [Thermoplasmata archaeon]